MSPRKLSLLAALLTVTAAQAHADSVVVFNLPTINSVATLNPLSVRSDLGGSDGLSLGSVSSTSTPAAVTPEPSSVILLATGVLSVVGLVVRKRFKAASQTPQRSPSAGSAFPRELAAAART